MIDDKFFVLLSFWSFSVCCSSSRLFFLFLLSINILTHNNMILPVFLDMRYVLRTRGDELITYEKCMRLNNKKYVLC